MTFTCGSLFTGIGGIDLAFVAAGFEILFQVEIDNFCRKVLEKHEREYWPRATRFTDVRDVGGHNLPEVDVLFGGFPCQDLSVAGKRMGITEGTRSGLWFEFARVIGDIRPRVVLLENVPGILTRDGTIVIADLAKMGYVGQWGTISASDVGAPHRRERWFCVAYRQHTGLAFAGRRDEYQSAKCCTINHDREKHSSLGNANAAGRREHSVGIAVSPQLTALECAGGTAAGASLEPGVGRNAARLPARLDRHQWPARPGQSQHVWEPPRVTSERENRTARLKALGNAVVPQVVYPIAQSICEWLAEQTVDEIAG